MYFQYENFKFFFREIKVLFTLFRNIMQKAIGNIQPFHLSLFEGVFFDDSQRISGQRSEIDKFKIGKRIGWQNFNVIFLQVQLIQSESFQGEKRIVNLFNAILRQV